MKVGLIGCGNIARKAYLPFAREQPDAFSIAAACDMQEKMAHALADDFGIPKVHQTPEALLADPEIEIVLNLTHPAAHASINLAALQAGKHVYSEKPFALDLAAGRTVLKTARERGLAVCCAPDTVLGSGIQSTRHLLEGGAVGRVLSARIHCAGPGPEHWHPNPDFYYKPGGGPMLDMGPYYLTALIHLLGPIKSVVGRTAQGYTERPIRCGDREGTVMPVETPTHYVGAIEMKSGALVQALFSFDHNYGTTRGAPMEFFGTAGCLRGTDPNCFDGEPELNTSYAEDDFSTQAITFSHLQGRGLGLVDMIKAIRGGHAPRCDGSIALHVLEAMLGFERSEATGQVVSLKSQCAQPPPMPQE